MRVQIKTMQHFTQILFIPTIVFDIEKYANTLFIGWIFWSVEIEFYKNPIKK